MQWIFVGASTIASQHMISAVRAQAGSDVTWIVSGSGDRTAKWADEHGIANSTADLAEALSDKGPACVYISSTNEKHHDQAMAAIATGKHVLCEKPLGMTLAEAHEMVGAAKAKGLVFGTNHHLRCSGTHRAVRDIIQSGQIGKVLSLRIHHAVHLPENLQGWRINDATAGGGVIPDITVHDADVARFLLGEDPVDVVAQMAQSGMGRGVEDSCMSVWSMPSGAMVMSHESFTHPFAGTGFEVHGTMGSIFASGVMTQMPVGSVTLVTAEGRREIPCSDHSLYVQGVADFTAAVKGQGAPAASGSDGIKSLAVALAVREAAQTGRKVAIEYGAPE
ncbi:Gfo/Idh/MocA family protein [Marivita geojedonensis]|uniref:Fructose reductase n=1 Tax=Marivita geojedonensis TaxID=1123756 RepID=A0A1X4NQ48_9RHOB|nr:Gfo/Idh/MocA family oxidoreductase [Marivita geojedonensis]OSQ53084.1 fructose reductase [Marivita geojedonensis]PRY81994.1 1,5-anhydro-D-fructose reductase (1,5-anhydro-D-mannitol-forming) [Marivita geojedonensis]